MNSTHGEKVLNANGSRDYLVRKISITLHLSVTPGCYEFIYPSCPYPRRRLANEHDNQTVLISGTYRDNKPGI